MTPARSRRSRRAWTVPRATRRVRDSSSTPDPRVLAQRGEQVDVERVQCRCHKLTYSWAVEYVGDGSGDVPAHHWFAVLSTAARCPSCLADPRRHRRDRRPSPSPARSASPTWTSTSCASSSASSSTTPSGTRSRSPAGTRWCGRSATPPRPPCTTSSCSGWSWSRTPARRPATATTTPTCCDRGAVRFVLKGGVRPEEPAARPPPPPRRRHRRHRARGARRRPLRRPRPRARRDDPRRAARPHRRARHGADRGDRDLRRHPAQPRRPLPLHGARTCRATSRAPASTAGRRASRSGCSRRSTTSSATSSSVAWTSGSTSTTGSWASRTWPSSSATTSPPSTRR